jgi:glycosyltransferase involved in cell wall biosynthesis
VVYWLLTTEYPPFHGGGISTYSVNTAKMMHKYGHDVTVFVQDYSVQGVKETIEQGVRVVRFTPSNTNTNKFLGYTAYLSYEFAHIIKNYILAEGKPAILEAQEYSGIAYYIQQFKLLGYPEFKDLQILITCHSPSFLCLEYNHVPVHQFPHYWTGQMEKACIKAADILVSPSRYFVSEVKGRMDWGNVQENYIPNPIDSNVAVSDTGVSIVPKKIVCFGKLAPLKGTFELLKYFDSLWQDGFTPTLHIVGGTDQLFHPEGVSMGDLLKKKYGAYLKKGLLKLHNEMAPQAAKKFIMRAHVVIVPSLFDNLPYTVLEAMSWGKVVLASMQGGQKEVIQPGQNGFLFDHTIPGDFQEKLQHILNLPTSELSEVGSNAQATIRLGYSAAAVYAKKIKVIEEHFAAKSTKKAFPFTEHLAVSSKEPSKEVHSDSLLSVVIPYHNMGPYIESCVQSIVESDYPHKEILIINDGSTDEHSLLQLSLLERKYNVQVYSKKNEGLPTTRNFGALKAKGSFLAFLDADDTVDKTYFSKAIRALLQYDNVHFVGSWVKYFGDSSDSWPTFNPEPPYLLLHNMVNSSSLVYKKEAFLMGGLNDAAMVYGMEDWDSVINLTSKGYRGVVLPELLFNYRVRKGSMARSFTRVKRQYLHQLIAKKHSSFYSRYGSEISLLNNCNGNSLDYDNPTFEVSSNSFYSVPSSIKGRIKDRVKRNKLIFKMAYKIYKRKRR